MEGQSFRRESRPLMVQRNRKNASRVGERDRGKRDKTNEKDYKSSGPTVKGIQTAALKSVS